MNRIRQTIDSAHKCGDLVTRKTGSDDDKGIVTGVLIRPDGMTWEGEADERIHYECELNPVNVPFGQ